LNERAAIRGLPQPARARESVCIAEWPRALDCRDETASRIVSQWCEAIKAIRNLKAERNVPRDAPIAPILVA
jgi:valyl-tRNA synthetase